METEGKLEQRERRKSTRSLSPSLPLSLSLSPVNQSTPALVITTSCSGLPYFAVTLATLSSPIALARSPKGPGVAPSTLTREVTAPTTSAIPVSTRPNTMLAPSSEGTGPGPVVIRNSAAL